MKYLNHYHHSWNIGMYFVKMSNCSKIFSSSYTIEKLLYFLALAHSFLGLINTCDMKSLSFSAHITFWTMGGHFENENRDCNDELWDANRLTPSSTISSSKNNGCQTIEISIYMVLIIFLLFLIHPVSCIHQWITWHLFDLQVYSFSGVWCQKAALAVQSFHWNKQYLKDYCL